MVGETHSNNALVATMLGVIFSNVLGEGHWAQARDMWSRIKLGWSNEARAEVAPNASTVVNMPEETPDRIANTMIWASQLGQRFHTNDRFKVSVLHGAVVAIDSKPSVALACAWNLNARPDTPFRYELAFRKSLALMPSSPALSKQCVDSPL